MTYPTALLEKGKPSSEVAIKDVQIIDGKYMAYVEGEKYTGWIKFWFLNFDQPTSFQDVLNQLEAMDWHEQMRDEVPA